MRKLTQNVSYLNFNDETDRPVLGYIRGKHHSLMFDAGSSPAHVRLYLRKLKEAGQREPDFCAVSHWHWDHSFGMSFLKQREILTIAGEATNRKLQELSMWTWDDESMEERLKQGKDIAFVTEMIKKEYPDRKTIQVECANFVFEQRLVLDLGGIHCCLIHIGGPHSRDSVICYIPEEKILFLGDSAGADLYENEWTYIPETAEAEMNRLPYDLERLVPYLRCLEQLDFEIAVEGHADPVSKNVLMGELTQAVSTNIL